MSNFHKIIISISSDIGFYLAKDWLSNGIRVSGTYRIRTNHCDELEQLGAKLIKCDLSNVKSIDDSICKLNKLQKWDNLVIATGSQEPIGRFIDCNIDSWSNSINVNFISQIRFIHGLLPNRNLKDSSSPSVLLFAGGGTNSATTDYSAYTISKIASIKMVELLDAEITDTSFSILGPGWVKTKIHDSTLQSPESAGSNYFKTVEMLEKNGEKCYPMEKVIECCNWILSSPRELVGGRNFSSVFDPWESDEIEKIRKDQNNFKLRRFGNDLFKKN
jgi:short-subunit dehydrogenase|tara:strand:- start:664 stop:1488 length:825 start_codon:yes stop_codon:yes gene_type:complete